MQSGKLPVETMKSLFKSTPSPTRAEIRFAVDTFLARGGRITVLPPAPDGEGKRLWSEADELLYDNLLLEVPCNLMI